MFTQRYNGMYINGYTDKRGCYVTDDIGTFCGRRFVSIHAAKIAITKARKNGIPASR